MKIQEPGATGEPQSADSEVDQFDPTAAIEALTNASHPIKTATSTWAQTELINPSILEDDPACTFWSEGWQRAAQKGLTKLLVSPEYGGSGLDLINALLTFEGLAHGCNDGGLVYGLTTQVWTFQPVLERFGSEEQKLRFLPGLCDGSIIGSFSITEPESGSDVFSLTTTAVAADDADDFDGYVLNGKKAFCTMSPVADVVIVFATSDPGLGSWGLSAFLVETDNPGITIGDNQPKMGLRTTPIADIELNDCRVSAENRLGPVGAGAAIFSAAMEVERAFMLVCQLGMMERMLDETAAYCADRQQFGTPINSFQAVSHRLADMKIAHDSSRLQLYRSAILQAQQKPSMLEASIAKVQISEAALACASAAMLNHGAKGYISHYGVESYLRNVAGGVIYGGTSDVQRNLIAKLL